jgi:hypothetical protein
MATFSSNQHVLVVDYYLTTQVQNKHGLILFRIFNVLQNRPKYDIPMNLPWGKRNPKYDIPVNLHWGRGIEVTKR